VKNKAYSEIKSERRVSLDLLSFGVVMKNIYHFDEYPGVMPPNGNLSSNYSASSSTGGPNRQTRN